MTKLSKEEINMKLEPRGIWMIGDYTGTRTRIEFGCSNGHIWMGRSDHILNGVNCPNCAGQIPKTPEQINLKLAPREIQMTGEYINRGTKIEFQCNNGHSWLASPGNILGGKGCPHCAKYGYNPGKPGWLYVLIFNGYIKYGITNNLNRRLKEHKKNGEYTIAITKLYEDGTISQNWERNVTIIFGGQFVSKEIMPDGYTETLSPDKLEVLLDTIQ